MTLDGLGGDDVLYGGRIGRDPDPRHSDSRVTRWRPGHDGPLLVLVLEAALGKDVGHVKPPVRSRLVVIGLGHAHLVRRQPPSASNFVRGRIVEPARLNSR